MSSAIKFAARIKKELSLLKESDHETYQQVAERNCAFQSSCVPPIWIWGGGAPIGAIERTTSRARNYKERLANQRLLRRVSKYVGAVKPIEASLQIKLDHVKLIGANLSECRSDATLFIDAKGVAMKRDEDFLRQFEQFRSLLAERGIKISETIETGAVKLDFVELPTESVLSKPNYLNETKSVKPYTEYWDVLGAVENEVILRRRLPNGINEEFVIQHDELESKGLKNLRPGRRIEVSKDSITGEIKFELQRYTRLESTPLLRSILQREKEGQMGR